LRSCAAVPARCRLRLHGDTDLPHLPSFPTRRSSDLSLLSDLVREALLGPEVVLRLDDGLERPVEVVPGRFLRGLHLLDRGVRRRDRKSTRLNSSHRTISYAVFCLKKKTASTSGQYRQ